VQEALTNVTRHANASLVSIRIQRERSGPSAIERLALSYEDDSVGMDMEQSSEGMGLVGMRERVIAVSGEFRIHSTVGKGTHIKATFPA
jgi:signal transduction histidine kinase